MLPELEIENFRCFEKLHAKPLARVNLLVGQNNAGKTAFLDAVELLTSARPKAWRDGLRRRGEYVEQTVKDPQTGVLTTEWVFYPAVLFSGHQLPVPSSFAMPRGLSIRATERRMELTCNLDEPSRQARLLLICSREPHVAEPVIDLGHDGTVRLIADTEYGRPGPQQSVLLVPTNRASIAVRSLLWEDAQANDEDALVYETLRYIEPRFDRLFLRGEGVNRNFWVRLKGQKELVRLGSLGEGMHHMLSIVLHLVNAKDRYLLIDEIDTGLHYTVLAKMWKMVIASARRLNIQVFATTHSMDCILALAEVHQQLDLTPEDLMVHRLVAGMDKTQTYTPSDLSAVAQFQGEVR